MSLLERMLKRRPCILLLVVVRPKDIKFPIVVPIPISIVTTLIETLGFWGSILRRLGIRLPSSLGKGSPEGSSRFRRLPVDSDGIASMITIAPAALEELWSGLISRGSWSLVDVKTSRGDRVLVRFV